MLRSLQRESKWFQGNTKMVLGFTGVGESIYRLLPVDPPPENHTGHTHTGTSHRVLVKAAT